MERNEFPKHGKRKRLRDRGERAEANSEGDNGGELSRTDEKYQFTRIQKASKIPSRIYKKTNDSAGYQSQQENRPRASSSAPQRETQDTVGHHLNC